ALGAPTCFSLFVQLKFRPQSSHEPPLARQLVPQKASGNGSLPGASLRYLPAPASDEPRSRGQSDNFPLPVDGPRKYLPPAVQSHLPDSRVWTSHRVALDRPPRPPPPARQRTAPGPCSTTLRNAHDHLQRVVGCSNFLLVRCAL